MLAANAKKIILLPLNSQSHPFNQNRTTTPQARVNSLSWLHWSPGIEKFFIFLRKADRVDCLKFESENSKTSTCLVEATCPTSRKQTLIFTGMAVTLSEIKRDYNIKRRLQDACQRNRNWLKNHSKSITTKPTITQHYNKRLLTCRCRNWRFGIGIFGPFELGNDPQTVFFLFLKDPPYLVNNFSDTFW